MDNILYYELIFDPGKKDEVSVKNILKVAKFQNLVEICCNCGKDSLTKKVSSILIPLSTQKHVNTKVYGEFANFAWLYFRNITTFPNQILEFTYWICQDQY